MRIFQDLHDRVKDHLLQLKQLKHDLFDRKVAPVLHGSGVIRRTTHSPAPTAPNAPPPRYVHRPQPEATPATRPAPTRPPPLTPVQRRPRPALRAPQVDQDKCTGCGECAEICSVDAISVQTVATIDATSCILCGACVFNCPEQAIDMPAF